MHFTNLQKSNLLLLIDDTFPNENDFWTKVSELYWLIDESVYPYSQGREDPYYFTCCDDRIVETEFGRVSMSQHVLALCAIRNIGRKEFADAWHHIYAYVAEVNTEYVSVSQAECLLLVLELLLESAGKQHRHS